MIVVPVELGVRRYDVQVGARARSLLAQVVGDRAPTARRAALVTHASLTAQEWFSDIDPGLPFDVHLLPEGEGNKTSSTVVDLCGELVRSGLTREDVVVAVGGGMVTDVAGFAAAVHHRGTPYVNVPTSLLGQVDAAIGGKTGVNLPEGKNLMGAFWQPLSVLCDTDVLGSLPPREWACGRGEMAKYAFIAGSTPDTSILELPLPEQVARCVAIKADVVASDEREGDRRMILNYGHTLAHALEAAAFGAEGLRHGEAVAIGIVFAAHLARRMGRIDDARVELHHRIVGGFGLSDALPAGMDFGRLVTFMARDKKASGGLTFVLDGPRGVEPVRGVDPDVVLATLAEMKSMPARAEHSDRRVAT
ncbi:MAG: 3-dehydroquinate synthase family protein [Acidimicrobiales bacterium]